MTVRALTLPNKFDRVEGMKSIMCLLLLVLLGTVAPAQSETNSNYQAEFDQSQIDLEKNGGKEYDSTVWSTLKMPVINSARHCKFPNGKKTKFLSVLRINANGKVLNWENKDLEPLFECFKTQMMTKRFPKPPFAPFHLYVEFGLGHDQ